MEKDTDWGDSFAEWDRFSEHTDKTWSLDVAMDRYRRERGLPPLRKSPEPAAVMKARHQQKREQRRLAALEEEARNEALKSLAKTVTRESVRVESARGSSRTRT